MPKKNLDKDQENISITCVNWKSGHRLWVTQPEFSPIDRPYFYIDLGMLWMSSTSECLLLCLDSGQALGALKYQPYKRCFEEWTIEGGADYSPYSQTGVGIWDIARLESGKVLIVHDMERFTPLAFDLRYTE